MTKFFVVCGLTLLIAIAHASSSFEEALQDAKTSYSQKRFGDSRQKLQEALKFAQKPNEKSSVLLKIGQTYRDENNLVSSRQIWQLILSLKDAPADDVIAARYAIGGTFLEEKNSQAARDVWQPVVDNSLISSQTKIAFQMAIATSFGTESKWPQAREALQKVIENPTIDLSTRAIAQQMVGDTYFSAQQWEEALSEFRNVTELIGLMPTLAASAQARLIETYRAMGDMSRAETESVRFQNSQVLLASEAISQKEYAKARQHFAAVLTLQNSRRSFALALQEKIGETYLAEGNIVQGRLTLQEVVQSSSQKLPDNEIAAFYAVQQNAQLKILESYINENKKKESEAALHFLLKMPGLLAPLRNKAEAKMKELN